MRASIFLPHFIVFITIVAMPLFAHAACTTGQLCNPLAANSIAEFVELALQAFVAIALPIVGFFILVSGFFFITAQGNSGKLADAKKNFMYVIIGAILILGASALAALIGGTIDQLR